MSAIANIGTAALTAAHARAADAAQTIAGARAAPAGTDPVVQGAVELKRAEAEADAAAAIIRTADEMTGTLLDMLV